MQEFLSRHDSSRAMQRRSENFVTSQSRRGMETLRPDVNPFKTIRKSQTHTSRHHISRNWSFLFFYFCGLPASSYENTILLSLAYFGRRVFSWYFGCGKLMGRPHGSMIVGNIVTQPTNTAKENEILPRKFCTFGAKISTLKILFLES